MESRLLGVLAALAISLAAPARAQQFIPLTAPDNAVLQAVARQLIVGTSGSFPVGPETQAVLMFVQNVGPVPSVIDGVFFDTSLSGILDSISLTEPIGDIAFRERQPTEPLPGAEGLQPPFASTFEISAVPPVATKGINNSTQADEVLFLLGGTIPALTDQLPAALSGANGKPLRVGIHVSSIAGYQDGGTATFISNNFASPIPEPAPWGAMVAGLGLLAARTRRRRAAT